MGVDALIIVKKSVTLNRPIKLTKSVRFYALSITQIFNKENIILARKKFQ